MGSLGTSSQGLAVVVGANKGIGLGVCRELQAGGYEVLATCRSTSPELDALSVKVLQGVDVTSAAGLEPLHAALQAAGKKLDSLQDLDTDDLDKHWQINAYGYRMSKTEVNMAGKLLAEDLAAQNIPVGIVHPGTVHTDMLRSLRISRGVTDEAKLAAGTLRVAQLSASICSYITSRLDMSTSGQFWAADTDTILPW